MMKALKVGIIGAGSIADIHIKAYRKEKRVEIIAISDLNEGLASEVSRKYGISDVYTDYKRLLEDTRIDAVSIATPTFTHPAITQDALFAGKHVLCEKPPAIYADDVRACAQAAKKSGKVLMYGLVCRFADKIRYLKKIAEAGELGRIYYAEAARIVRCFKVGGWFVNKEKAGGGMLIDGAIHELDSALYIMGYPRPKLVTGFTSNINKDLPDKVKGFESYWNSADPKSYDRTTESMAAGLVTFENGACLYVKASNVLNSVFEGKYIDLCGDKSGVRLENLEKLTQLSISKSGFFKEETPVIHTTTDFYDEEIRHFTDCCIDGTECIIKPEEAVILMDIINAIYKSGETGEPVKFNY